MIEQYKTFFSLFFMPETNVRENKVSFAESIILAWPFVLLKNLFYLAVIVLGLEFFRDLASESVWLEGFEWNRSRSLWIILLNSVVEILLFPLLCFFNLVMWRIMLRFFQWYLQDKQVNLASDLVSSAMSSHVLLVVPFLGQVFKELSFHFILFQGIRKRLKLNSFASFLIILSPIIWIMLLVGVWVMSLVILWQLLS
jgi:hypothetical protein